MSFQECSIHSPPPNHMLVEDSSSSLHFLQPGNTRVSFQSTQAQARTTTAGMVGGMGNLFSSTACLRQVIVIWGRTVWSSSMGKARRFGECLGIPRSGQVRCEYTIQGYCWQACPPHSPSTCSLPDCKWWFVAWVNVTTHTCPSPVSSSTYNDQHRRSANSRTAGRG